MRWLKSRIECGLRRPLEVREEVIHPAADGCRIAYVSDIHLRRGRSARLSDQVVAALEIARAEVILLGGDLIDQLTEVDSLGRLLRRLQALAPVLAIPGNHDVAAGVEEVRACVIRSGAEWIEGRTASIELHGRRFAFSGPGAPPPFGGGIQVLCAHHPRIWKSAQRQGYDLVLAGHLHGCQVVAFEARGKLYPGALFYPSNHLRQRQGDCHLIVSRGCADLIPFRWACPREIVVCTL